MKESSEASAQMRSATLVAELLRQVTTPGDIPDVPGADTPLASLGVDSLSLLNLLVRCGEQFGKSAKEVGDWFPDLDRIQTVQDVNAFVDTLMAEASLSD